VQACIPTKPGDFHEATAVFELHLAEKSRKQTFGMIVRLSEAVESGVNRVEREGLSVALHSVQMTSRINHGCHRMSCLNMTMLSHCPEDLN
jgi:hypothetical protein